MYVMRHGLGSDGVDLSTLYPGINPDTIPSSACTCIGGVCAENGNSCSSVAPAGPVGSPAYIAQQLALQNAALTTQYAIAPPFNFTAWINNNAGSVAIGAAVLFGAVLLGSRR